ncbi:MAG: MBL fold metallo-hydrolase [Muribaculaceae bacterium]|nr:MBL fold metallo-hydrolase [Muribaculaceae bacterium]
MSDFKPSRRLSRQLDDLPGLFDDIDISRPDIAGDIIVRATAPKKKNESEISEIDVDRLEPRKALRFISFGSGSSGNCAYIGNDRGGVLIDAGIEGKFVTEQLLHNGIDISEIKGILLTHDHGDHVKFAYSILRYNRHMRLFCTPKTLNGLLRRHSISRRIKDYHAPIFKEFPFEIGDLTITAFEVSHDGTDNVGYSIESDGVKIAVVTDTGYITERADFYMRQSNAIMLEANYDAEMLRNGTYTEHLKARIASQIGHLDNAVTAAYLASIASPALSHVFLCHLSHDNNCPEIALSTVRSALQSAGVKLSDHPLSPGLQLCVLPRFAASPLYIIKKQS